MQIHVCEPPGDILVFLTGEEEIEDACKKIGKEIQQMGDQACHCNYVPCTGSLHPHIAVVCWRQGLSLHTFCRLCLVSSDGIPAVLLSLETTAKL